MFTGIVEEQGVIAKVEDLGDSLRLGIDAQVVVQGVRPGDSIAVSGVCLTVVDPGDSRFYADVMRESLNRSTLGQLGVGDRVNLERALAVSDRLGGHIVQGHVDATTALMSRTSSEHWDVLRFALPESLAPYVVEKGSITLSGASLTVSGLGDGWFEVSLIPTTLEITTLGILTEGSEVNVEVDVLAKYVERQLVLRGGQRGADEDMNELD